MATAKKSNLEPITANPRFAAASGVLRTLEDGLAEIERIRAWHEAEIFLARRPDDKAARAVRERYLKQQPTESIPDPAQGELPPVISAALALVRDGTRPPIILKPDRRAAIQKLDTDATLVREAIVEWAPRVDAIRDELSAEVANRIKTDHRARVAAQFRALQALSAATSAEQSLHRDVTAAGYVWRSDINPAPSLRSALITGSEADHDSEVSRTRRMLEEHNII